MSLFNIFKTTKMKCPYCGIIIEKEPKAKFKCPNCKEEIYIQKSGEKKILIKKSEYETLQSEKKRIAEENKYFKFFEDYDLSRPYLEKRKFEWFNKFREKANYSDLIWSLSNELLNTFAKKNDYSKMRGLYFDMAILQKKQNKEFYHLLKESRRMELYEIQKQLSNDIKYKVVIIGGEPGCEYCNEFNGKSFTIEEALEEMPIPHPNCSNDGWCTCCYTVKIIRSS